MSGIASQLTIHPSPYMMGSGIRKSKVFILRARLKEQNERRMCSIMLVLSLMELEGQWQARSCHHD